MPCDLTTLLVDAACYIGRPAPVLQAASLELWCTISGGVTPPPAGGWTDPSDVAWTDADGNTWTPS